jgi:hypothetical protein
MAFTDSRVILPLFSLSASSSSSSCSSGSSSSSSNQPNVPPLSKHPSYATGAEKAEMYIPPPCLTRALQSFSPTLSCCIQATRSRRLFTHRRQILTLHNRAAPKALHAIGIYGRETKERDQWSSQINLRYRTVLCISPKGLDSINVTLPDGCPNKRRLPRDSEQLGRYSEGSQRRLDSP